ncbi:nSTAND1 domain-containing NTPase [Kribbella sp. NPDC055110]
MARVFISHAGSDTQLATEIHAWLTAAGHEVFFDRDRQDGIRLGDDWEATLRERLRWADAVVSLVTSPYLKSIWCTVEITIARERGSRILPVIGEDGVQHPLLNPLQYVELAHARNALTDALARIDAGGAVGWPDDMSPFPGLESFDADRRRVFFGRSGDVNELVELLRSPAWQARGEVLLLVGPSGCGKSSLVRAGLLPAMADDPEWLTVRPFRPGQDPVAELARQLADVSRLTPSALHKRLADEGLSAVVDDLLVAAPGRRRRLLIVVDQFEELVSQTAVEEKARFAQLLLPALAGRVQVVATLRPEFLEQMQVDPVLDGLRGRTSLVGPLRQEALRGVIEGPADVAGIAVPAELVSRMVDDTSSGDALPLLAFTLEQLSDGVRRGGELSVTRYQQLGGVRGALTKQAEIALRNAAESGGRTEKEIVEGLLNLVTVDENGQPTRRLVNSDDLSEVVAGEYRAFVERRLLTTSSHGDGVIEIGVAHEAFLTAWEPLRSAIAGQRAALRARRMIEAAAADWESHNHPRERLWERGQLAAAVRDTGAYVTRRQVVSRRVDLAPAAREFLRRSLAHDRNRRWRSTTILSILLALALTAAGIAAAQRNSAESERRTATVRQLIAQAEAAQTTDPRTALRLALAADRLDPSARTRWSLITTLLSSRYAGTLTGHRGSVDAFVFSTDGRLMATVDGGRLILWDISDSGQPRSLGPPLKPDGGVSAVAFAPDGRTIATSGAAGDRVLLWDITDPMAPRQRGAVIDPGVDGLDKLEFAPDGRTLLVAGHIPSVLSLWSAVDGAQVAAPFVVDMIFKDAWFFADSSVLVTSTVAEDSQDVVRRWDLRKPAAHIQLGQPITYWRASAFDPRRGVLATDGSAHSNTQVILRDLSNPSSPRQIGKPLPGVRFSADQLTFSPDARSLAIKGDGGLDSHAAVQLFDVNDLTDPKPYDQPPGQLRGLSGAPQHFVDLGPDGDSISLAFVPGRSEMVVMSDDGTANLWDLTDRAWPRATGHAMRMGSGGVSSAMAVLPDGKRLLTSRPDGTIVVWDLTGVDEPRSFGQPVQLDLRTPISLAFSADGRTLVASAQESIAQFDVSNPAGPRPLGPSSTVYRPAGFRDAALSPRGDAVAVIALDGVVVADTRDPARKSLLRPPLLTGVPGDGEPSDAAFSADGRLLAVKQAQYDSGGNYLALLDTSDPGHVRRFDSHLPPVDYASAMAISPTGATLARATGGLGSSPTIELWNISDSANPRQAASIASGHSEDIREMAISPDGKVLVTSGLDQTIVLTDISDPSHPLHQGLPLAPADGEATALTFSPNGRMLAARVGGALTVWDLSDTARPRLLGRPLTTQVSRFGLNAFAFAPDGRTLAVAGNPSPFPRGRLQLTLVDFSPVIDTREHATQLACARVGRGLDAAEWGQYVGDLPYQQTCG